MAMILSNGSCDPLVELDSEHFDPLRDTVRHLLATPLAESTFAEIADGLPTQEACSSKTHGPPLDCRQTPTADSLELVKCWCQELRWAPS